MEQRHLVAVYGTVKRNHYNHITLAELDEVKYLGTITLDGFRMFSINQWFPGIVYSETDSIEDVEVFEITETQLKALDQLEGFNRFKQDSSLYLRRSVTTPFGEAWIYVYAKGFHDYPTIKSWTHKSYRGEL